MCTDAVERQGQNEPWSRTSGLKHHFHLFPPSLPSPVRVQATILPPQQLREPSHWSLHSLVTLPVCSHNLPERGFPESKSHLSFLRLTPSGSLWRLLDHIPTPRHALQDLPTSPTSYLRTFLLLSKLQPDTALLHIPPVDFLSHLRAFALAVPFAWNTLPTTCCLVNTYSSLRRVSVGNAFA